MGRVRRGAAALTTRRATALKTAQDNLSKYRSSGEETKMKNTQALIDSINKKIAG